MAHRTQFPDEEDEEDELIADLDVYHSQPPPHRELFVLDYPSRSFLGPSIGRDRAAEQVRLRPNHGRVEVTLSAYPRTSDDLGHSDKSFDFDRMTGNERWSSDSQTFVSCASTPPPANFSAGMYLPPASVADGNGCVVLVPVAKIARMRPSFAYLDEVDANRLMDKAMLKAGRDQAKGDLEPAAAEDGGNAGAESQIEMTFTMRETDKAAERRKQSFAHITKLEELEKWVTLDFLDHTHGDIPASRDSIFRRESVAVDAAADETGGETAAAGAVAKTEDAIMTDAPAAGAPEPQPADDDAASESYIDRLYRHAPSVNPMNDQSRRLTQMGHRFDSVRALHTARPESAVEKMLTHARVACFDVLRSCVSKDITDDVLVAHVRKSAFLLRGVWVRKTPKGNWRGMAPGGRAAPRIPAARTLILDLFRLGPVVSVSDVVEIAMDGLVPPTEAIIREVLDEVAVFKKSVGWLFKLAEDTEFCRNFPEVVQAEDEAWVELVETARTTMKTGRGPAGAGGSAAGGAGRGRPKR